MPKVGWRGQEEPGVPKSCSSPELRVTLAYPFPGTNHCFRINFFCFLIWNTHFWPFPLKKTNKESKKSRWKIKLERGLVSSELGGVWDFSEVIFVFPLVFVGCCDIKASHPVSRKPRGKFVPAKFFSMPWHWGIWAVPAQAVMLWLLRGAPGRDLLMGSLQKTFSLLFIS